MLVGNMVSSQPVSQSLVSSSVLCLETRAATDVGVFDGRRDGTLEDSDTTVVCRTS